MATQEIPSQQRISKSTGRMMIGVAILFDLLPLMLLIVVVVFMMYSATGNMAEDLSNIAKANQAAQNGTAHGFWGWLAVKTIYGIGGARVAVKAGAALFAGGLGAIILGPIVYTIGSFFASTFAYIIFTVWFFVKGVNIWSFSSTERVLVNMSAIIVENIPLLDLLPGITFMAWRHVKISRAEDTIKDSELLNKASKVASKLAYV